MAWHGIVLYDTLGKRRSLLYRSIDASSNPSVQAPLYFFSLYFFSHRSTSSPSSSSVLLQTLLAWALLYLFSPYFFRHRSTSSLSPFSGLAARQSRTPSPARRFAQLLHKSMHSRKQPAATLRRAGCRPSSCITQPSAVKKIQHCRHSPAFIKQSAATPPPSRALPESSSAYSYRNHTPSLKKTALPLYQPAAEGAPPHTAPGRACGFVKTRRPTDSPGLCEGRWSAFLPRD